MDKFINHTQMQTILDGRPKGVSMDQVIAGYQKNGYKIEGIDATSPPPAPVENGAIRAGSSILSNTIEAAKSGVTKVVDSVAGGADRMRAGVEEGGLNGAKKFGRAALETGLGAASGAAQTVFSPLTGATGTAIQGYKELDDATGGHISDAIHAVAAQNPEIIQQFQDMIKKHPQAAKDIEDAITVLGVKAGVPKAVSALDQSAATVTDLAKGTVDLTKAATTGAKDAVIGTVDKLTTILPKNLGQKAVDLVSADPDKKVATILQRTTPEEVSTFTKMAEKAASDGEAPTPLEATGEKLADTTKILKSKLDEIGKAKSAIIEPLREGLGAFKEETKPLILGLTKLKNSFSEIDKGRKTVVQAIINDAKTVSTKLDADKFIDKVQDAIYSGNADQTIVQGSSLDKQLRGIVGEYNTKLKASLPKEYGQLNAQYSDLISHLNIINRSLGDVVDGVPLRGASLIKQYFSPSGTKAKEIFDYIKKETSGEVDLAKDATLSKFAMELYDDPRARSLLQGISEIPTTVGGVVKKVVEKVGGDKLTNAMRKSTIRKATKSAKGKATPAKGE